LITARFARSRLPTQSLAVADEQESFFVHICPTTLTPSQASLRATDSEDGTNRQMAKALMNSSARPGDFSPWQWVDQFRYKPMGGKRQCWPQGFRQLRIERLSEAARDLSAAKMWTEVEHN